ncbi:VOC family protein [Mycolicibacterium arenosum]|uniref:VOC family protein n=1 Tax=Mycolicibacterium arenosum TaxID=2952157 RepID=A0ABT1M4K7_9MYCO|nr:VOC family protein [Mycolicibacterium sp. CAU 1645]MCP9274041.1 VOC family protein [Mycolicibacterium sp. CAU 1645]
MSTESFLEVTLYVADVRRSAAFYRAAGIPLFDREDGMRFHVDGGIGVTALQLYPAVVKPVSSVQLGFRVTDIGILVSALTEIGADFETPGPRRLTTQDPDGNRVHFSEIVRSGP